MTKKRAGSNPLARQQPKGEPTVEGWMFLSLSGLEGEPMPVVTSRGVVKSRIGPAYLLHFVVPVQYGMLIDIQDMQDVLLFPNHEALGDFLKHHERMGGKDLSIPQRAENEAVAIPEEIVEEKVDSVETLETTA